MTDIKDIIDFFMSLFIIGLLYFIFMPFLNMLILIFLKLGAPLAFSQFLPWAERMSFAIFLIAAVFVFFGKVFRKEPTTYRY